MFQPKYRIRPYLLNQIAEASRLKAWIDNASIKVGWLPTMQREARAKNTHSSTAIEGNPLSLSQVQAIGQGEKIGVLAKHEIEVANYFKILRRIEKRAHLVVTEAEILKLHRILMRNLLPEDRCGRYKDRQNYIVNGRGIKIYTPPAPGQTPGLMEELVNWVNSGESKELHAVLVSAIFHYQFVSIHPFSDGNGRLARALSTGLLYQRDFDLRHIFSLDDYFAQNRSKYYLRIEQARELDEDLTLWLEYVAEGIVATLQNVTKRIESLQVSQKHKIVLSQRQEDLLRFLRDRHTVGIFDFQGELKLSRARVNKLLAPLLASGLVIREGRSRATQYRLA